MLRESTKLSAGDSSPRHKELAVPRWKIKVLPVFVVALSMAIASLAGCVGGLLNYLFFGIFW
jgi:hypothetical protein